ncbi:MAG: DNA polymerase III subunit delta [Acidobacteriota bacterium]|nr:DNA polymerase III subunit delta [Acidobacteriota bacterium]
MSPDQFLASLEKKRPAPVYLFLGPEPYQRERCRRALLDAALGTSPEDRDGGLTRVDLSEVPLAAALDDARALSLFAAQRVIWIGSAEAVLPRGRAGAADSVEAEDASDTPLAAYLREPTPGTVVVLESSRYGFEGEDKPRIERVQKYFAAIAAQVEFRPFSPEAARSLAQTLAKQAGLQLGLAELALLLDATGGDASRIAVEIEKLRLFTGGSRKVTAGDIAALVADAQASTIFVLVAALGRGDRTRALETLDTLAREGEYMPLALTFLATQFRTALAAREAGLRSASQIQAHFSKLGARMWPERARQIEQTIAAFSTQKLERAVGKLFEADRALRDARPDDRIVMEELILALTAA